MLTDDDLLHIKAEAAWVTETSGEPQLPCPRFLNYLNTSLDPDVLIPLIDELLAKRKFEAGLVDRLAVCSEKLSQCAVRRNLAGVVPAATPAYSVTTLGELK